MNTLDTPRPRSSPQRLGRGVLAAAMALAMAGTALAADPGPWLVNNGGDVEVVYGPRPGNVVGGAHASVAGAGDDSVYSAAFGGQTQRPTGFVAAQVNVGGDDQLVYTPLAPTAPGSLMAAR